MNQVKVLVCDPIHREGITRLEQAGFVVDVRPDISKQELSEVVSNYDALVVRSRTKVTEEILHRGKKLKVIGRVGVGLDNIDLEAAERQSIKVFNSPEAPAVAVAELTMGLLLSLARRIPFADSAIKDGKWIKKQLKGWQLEGKILGILGLGNIGLRVARMARTFGMRILITKRTPPTPELLTELEGEYVSFDTLLKRSDIITIHIPLNTSTKHIIGEEEIKIMKDGAYLINTARGPLLDEKALLKGLRSGKLAGAALDVYTIEPPKEFELVKLPNVVCTPHIGGQTEESQRKAATIIADKIVTHLTS